MFKSITVFKKLIVYIISNFDKDQFLYRKLTLIRYHSRNHSLLNSDKQKIILCVDNYGLNGGLTDRLKAIVSIYHLSCNANIDFKLKFDYPFHIEEYFVLRQHQIIANKNDLKWSILNSKFIYIKDDPNKIFNIINYFKSKQISKTFIYTNLDCLPLMYGQARSSKIWAQTFNDLFFFKNILIEKFNYYLSKNLNTSKYLIFHARFTTLLNDFSDVTSHNLSNYEKNKIIEKVWLRMVAIAEENKEFKIMIFSDSKVYLNHAIKFIKDQNINNLFIYNGEPKHTDRKNNSSDNYEYEFLTFLFMINSTSIYQFIGNGLYKSQFPLYASMIKNVDLKYVS